MSDAAPWLDDEEMTTWLAFVRVVMRLPNALDGQVRQDAGISYFEYSVLVVLEHAEDQTMRMSDLAFLCNGSLSRLSHVARRLEDGGLIRRFSCPTDGRSTLAALTDGGRELLAKAAPGHVRLVRALVFDDLTRDEMRQLGELSERILARIQA
ncbi:MarR family transcriptional regulator [Glycomyces sp. TRM65418]|uniref:MarR family winged helix-turn-helix transcriptional regulator n=1 Tax=Glycomyces sp. TRM65418 TaxID=2867006 RepID=UPI001CE4DC1F|nr:MarR family transcriptional regulator [Glycomyces sp. TRM65418]MCC3763637.1 MarR family transcriptional regulator [Glycomyces sp. TRM65418]QZD57620.1 MarR family transcriptional regulator [Glycomyces sp. TRM65418]